MKYIAFLRGINVGKIRIKMADLKVAFEKMGFNGVTTYLQTGNVTFQSENSIPEVKATLEKGLSETFNYDAYVLIYPFEALGPIIKNYPFARRDTHHAYIIFVETAAVFAELCGLISGIDETKDRVVEGEGILYWELEKGSSTDTPFSKILAKVKYKSTTTVRNINTLELMTG